MISIGMGTLSRHVPRTLGQMGQKLNQSNAPSGFTIAQFSAGAGGFSVDWKLIT